MSSRTTEAAGASARRSGQFGSRRDWHDPCVRLLDRSLGRDGGGTSLLLAEDNAVVEDWVRLTRDRRARVVANRYGLAAALARTGVPAVFADHNLAFVPDGCLGRLVFRVAKEKPLVHHVLNQARRKLAIGGELHLAGWRREGIKTYVAKAAELLGELDRVRTTNAGARCAVIRRSRSDLAPPLPDQDYTAVRRLRMGDGSLFFTKPGCFGWRQVDQGSATLAACLPSLQGARVLDLGCGYGYLSVCAARRGAARVVATDNNAAALRACLANFREYSIAGAVVAGDVGNGVSGRFDVIVCNPPLHRGFARYRAAADVFLAAMARFLTPDGAAFVVVNRKVPYERLALSCFSSAEILRVEAGFKVLRVTGPGGDRTGR